MGIQALFKDPDLDSTLGLYVPIIQKVKHMQKYNNLVVTLHLKKCCDADPNFLLYEKTIFSSNFLLYEKTIFYVKISAV